ncbi:hypothetical protein H6G06_05780 [Anabaena sphaerica FACHB-251]|uniref:Uncharacterized protein n=1 Tax=Anabaena sphaerica FACHB-251 TaxID=2692883 RepID=A0A926WED0_9NOST|nr:hypothetical protein [Anabaena sphaerica]MBD2293004.1 hypothetical protein [Anabaena sphaerica FACHB-251]
MLIRIDSSVINNENQSSLAQDTVTALELLALTRREGKHILIGDRNTLQKISKCTDLSKSTREIYQKLLDKYEYFKLYLSAVTKYIEVTNSCTEPQLFNYSGKQVIKVPPKFFNDSVKIQPTILLCENNNDATFYEIIAKVYCVWNNIPVILKYSPRGAGGSTIGDEYTRIQQARENICLCIADSDRIAPNGEIGGTAKIIKDDPKYLLRESIILDLHEIENLIPKSILDNLCSANNSYRQKSLAILEAIETSSVKDLQKFLDIKNGTRLEKIVRAKNSDIKDYWKERLPEIPDISNRIDSWCHNNWSCSKKEKEQKEKKEKCINCPISFGFGDNILEDAINELNQKEPKHIANIIDKDMRQEWEKVGEVILNWCCATSPIRG